MKFRLTERFFNNPDIKAGVDAAGEMLTLRKSLEGKEVNSGMTRLVRRRESLIFGKVVAGNVGRREISGMNMTDAGKEVLSALGDFCFKMPVRTGSFFAELVTSRHSGKRIVYDKDGKFVGVKKN